MSLTLSSFKRCFDMLTLEDQKTFVSQLDEVKKLKKGLNRAMNEGDLVKYVCECGKYLIVNPDTISYYVDFGSVIGVRDDEMNDVWILDAQITDNGDFEWLENNNCYVHQTPRNQTDFDWDKHCVRGLCQDCNPNFTSYQRSE